MKHTKKELEDAILIFAEKYELKDNYTKLIDSGVTLPELSRMIILQMFINRYNNYFASDNYYYAHEIIFEYQKELSENGFVEFKK